MFGLDTYASSDEEDESQKEVAAEVRSQEANGVRASSGSLLITRDTGETR